MTSQSPTMTSLSRRSTTSICHQLLSSIISTLLISLLITPSTLAYEDDNPLAIGKCQRITVPLCINVPYNFTRLPNMLGHRDQEKVTMDVQHFEPLVHTECSPHVKFFVCSIYTPMCSENVEVPVTSCRTVCEEVKTNCMSILNKFGLHWPEMLNCSRFPQEGELCMEPMSEAQKQTPGAAGSTNQNRRPFPPRTMEPMDDRRCPPDMLDLVDAKSPSQCFSQCNSSLMFRQEHKHFAEIWMAIWSTLCCVITAFTVVTYAMDSSRFRFPERSIVYLAGCYHFYSWVYVLRAFVINPDDIACKSDPNTSQWYLIANGLDSPVCALTFIVLYYFSMAASLWWVVLTFTWFLAAYRKWGIEVIEQYSSYFHFIAWGLPALLSITVLINQKVDASELTHLCFVGNIDQRALIGYVILPLFILLQIGCAFTLAGFVGICSVRRLLIAQRDKEVYKLEKLMFKIGVFSILYAVPAVCVIGCYVYHAYVLYVWEPSSTKYIECVENLGAEHPLCEKRPAMPTVEVYMLQMFMSLIVGITSGMWVMSRKTCITWRRFICCGNLRGVDQKLPSLPPNASLPGSQHVQQQQVQVPLMSSRYMTGTNSYTPGPGSAAMTGSNNRKYMQYAHTQSRYVPSSEASKL